MNNFIRELKRKISQHFETMYWYHFRKPMRLWYDEDDKKWHQIKDKKSVYYNAEGMLAATWEGEVDLLHAFLLKLDHMIWNIRKYGNDAGYYFYLDDVEKYGNDKDKYYYAKQVIKQAFKDDNKSLFILNIPVDEKWSDNSKASVYIKANDDLTKLRLVVETSLHIPQETIPKKNKFYTLNSYIDENGKRQYKKEYAEQYKTKQEITAYEWNVSGNFADFVLSRIDGQFEKYLKEFVKTNFDVEVVDLKTMLEYVLDRSMTYCPQFEVEQIPNLSKELREHATGNRVKVQRMLRLRRMVKKIINLDDTDYNSQWVDEEDEDLRHKKMEKATKQYRADRKKLYRAIADFLAENGDNWWD